MSKCTNTQDEIQAWLESKYSGFLANDKDIDMSHYFCSFDPAQGSEPTFIAGQLVMYVWESGHEVGPYQVIATAHYGDKLRYVIRHTENHNDEFSAKPKKLRLLSQQEALAHLNSQSQEKTSINFEF